MTIHDLLSTQINDVWGRGLVDLVDRHYADDVVDHMPIPGQPAGRSAMKDVVQLFRKAMPDLQMHLHATLAAGDMGADLWTLTGTHTGEFRDIAPTGNRIEMSGIDMVRVANAQISELWHVEEMLQFWQQIGHVDAPFGQPSIPPSMQPLTSAAYDPGAGVAIAISNRPTATELRNIAIAREHIEHMWARSKADLGYKLYASDAVDHNPAPGQRPGVEGIVDVIHWMTQSVPELQMQIHQYVVDGDYVADRWTMRGVHSGAPMMGLPAKGRSFEINGMDVIRVNDDGRISDVWHVEEFDRMRAAIS
jgi:steroid delta-isomerase-like uncharacterized protein